MSYRDEIKKRPGSQLLPWQVFDALGRADARIAELERECSQWRDELRIYREAENARIAVLEYRLSRLLHAAENVRRWDWSDNDEDCVDDILKLGDAIDAASANGGES